LKLILIALDLQSGCSVAGLDRYNISDRQLEGICAQRKLDPFFGTISNNTDFFRAFFGSVDGTTRVFPGSVMFVEIQW